jgi:GNAT superfamily N-acetyltransferase
MQSGRGPTTSLSEENLDRRQPRLRSTPSIGDDQAVIGFLSLHYIPQIGVEGSFARISYLCVDENAQSKGVGTELECAACRLATARECDRIELHCHSRRTDAPRFYARRGYTESPKYFVKKLSWRAEDAACG